MGLLALADARTEIACQDDSDHRPLPLRTTRSTARWRGAFGAIAAPVLGLLVGGIESEVRRVRQRREVERALREWDQLAAAAAATRAAGGSLVELLQSRGYRVYEVRQWLLRHLEA